MKQYLSRQLWMLAILLFAGIGNAFGYTITANIDGLPYGNGGVKFNISGIQGDHWASNGGAIAFDENASVLMTVQSLNSVYAISKVEINDGTNTTDITDNYINDNGDKLIYNFGVLDKDYTVNVEFYKKNQSVNVTVSWNTEVFPGLSYHFEDDYGQGWIFAENSGGACELEKNKTFYLYFDNLSSIYSITSIKIDGQEVTGDYNENKKRIQVEVDDDHTIDIEIAKASTNTITVTGENDEINIYFEKWMASNNRWAWAGPLSQGVWELLSGEGTKYRMYLYVKNTWVYSIGSVVLDDTEDITNTILYQGYYDFENLSADHTITIAVNKEVANTNTVTVNFDGGKTDYVEFYDPENDRSLGAGNDDATELPSGSTIRLNIYPRLGWKVKTLTVDADAVAYNGSYYEFTNLSANHIVNIEYEVAETHTITVAYDSDVANVLDGIWIDGHGISSNESLVFNDGSNVTMTISCPNYLYSVSIVDNSGDPIPLNMNQYGEYEYVFSNLSADHSVSIVLTKAKTNKITVTGGEDKVDVYFEDNNWNGIKPSASGVCELLPGEGTKYRMNISINNYWVYSIGSVMLDDTEDITNTILSQGYYDFENLSADHTVTIVVNKEVAKTQTIKVNNDNRYSYVEFYNPQDHNYMYANNGVATELPSGSTIRLMINLGLGWKVKTLKVDGEEVAFNGSYYEFTNLSADHIVDIEYETAETHTITVAYDTEYINRVNLNGSRVSNNVYKFNEGSDAKMTIYCKDGYKPVLTIDNGDPVTPDKIRNGQYEYVFSNLSADHNVNIAYAPITYHSITVNFDNIRAQLNTAQNSYNWITSGVSNQFEDGDVVTLVLNINTGYSLTSLKVGDTDINGAYDENGNYTYTFAPLSSDLVVNATIESVESYYINAWFNQGSQGTIYMESVMTGRIETTGRSFNKGSDVTLIVEPAIGYEVSKIILGENNSNKAPEEVNFTEDDGLYKFTISGLSNSYSVEITTQKKSMTGSELFTLDDAGMCTCCSEKDLDFTNVSGITAYIATGFNPATGSVVLTRVEKVPAGTGLLIKGKPGNYSIPVVETNCYNMNMLTGIVKPKQISEYDWKGIEYTNYILQSDGVFRIVNYSNNQLDAHKAYLQIPTNLVPAKAESRILIEWGAPKGDVDGDGVVDIADAVRIVNFIVGKIGNLSRRIDNSIDNNPGEPE